MFGHKPKETLAFEVTPDDIDTGKRRSVVGCPLALAIDKKLGDGSLVSVGVRDVYVYPADSENRTRIYAMSKSATTWQVAWDSGIDCKPEAFELERVA